MNSPRDNPPSRQTVIAAATILKSLGHAGFDQMLLEFGTPEGVGYGNGLKARAASLAAYVLDNSAANTAEGVPIGKAVVERAVQLFLDSAASSSVTEAERQAFRTAAERDGLFPPAAGPPDDGLVLGGEDEGNGWTGASITLSGPDLTKLRGGVAAQAAKPMVSPRRVFIVHGHDEAARYAVSDFLRKADFDPVVLHDQPNKGRTISSKCREEADDVGSAVVLMTPDDEGAKAGASSLNARARQNVVFELGFFIGKLGPERVAALVKGPVERPSDFDGIVYIEMDAAGGWRFTLGRELQAAGLKVDWDKVMRS